MSTNSTIGILREGVLRTVYLHWGSPEEIGGILLGYYTDSERVERLIELGDLSVIKPLVCPPEGVTHSFRNPYPNVTIAYHRDREEDWADTRYKEFVDVGSSIRDLDPEVQFDDFHMDYIFIFDASDGRWYYSNRFSEEMINRDLSTIDNIYDFHKEDGE